MDCDATATDVPMPPFIPWTGLVPPRVTLMQSQAHPDTEFEFETVQALRGRESSTTAKWETRGWELVSERRGVLRTELTFRRVKPKTFVAYLTTAVAAFRRLTPRTQLLVASAAVVVLLAGVIGLSVAVRSSGKASEAGSPAPTVSSPAPAGSRTTLATSPTPSPSDQGVIVDISVDALLDKLNAGQSRAGEVFRVTGDLFHSDLWFTGVTGDYAVMVKAKGGAQDLTVLLDEAAAAEWQDGTKVELVVKNVERTIDGETSDGWLEVQSAKII